MTIKIGLILGLLIETAAFANSDCPNTVLNIDESENFATITVFFDNFSTDSDLKRCDFTFQIDVPNGKRMGVYKIDYRGFAILPKFGKGYINVSYDFANSKGPDFHKQIVGPVADNFFFTDVIGAGVFRGSRCGGKETLNMTAKLSVDTRSSADQGFIAMDSGDGNSKAGVAYHFKLKSCR